MTDSTIGWRRREGHRGWHKHVFKGWRSWINVQRYVVGSLRGRGVFYTDTNAYIADGAIGGTAQKIGGPLDKQGAIGQHFNADGKIGGMVQENLANKNSSH